DTIMLLHVSPRKKQAVMVSIPRDLKVRINGHYDKINAAYAIGGPSLLVNTIRENFGVTINHYAEIDFGGFLNVVDALGGVTLCNNTSRTLRDHYSGLNMTPGCHLMNGQQSLSFVRARYIDSDFGRIHRQQEFMRAVMSKATTAGSILNIPRTFNVSNA